MIYGLCPFLIGVILGTVVVDSLEPEELQECCHRLGFLNLFTALTVDRNYKINLKVPDERKMAAVLTRLAVVEPGENWVEAKFQRKETMPSIPGWQLPAEWTKVIGTSGILELRYTSTEKGCRPNVPDRLKLNLLYFRSGQASNAAHARQQAIAAAEREEPVVITPKPGTGTS